MLGANDGLVSTAGLMVGVAASGAANSAIVTAGLAGVAAGSTAMGRQSRGIPRPPARQVAVALHKADPLEAHLWDELGHHEASAARPVQAWLASASSFLVGGLVPFLGLPAPTSTTRLVSIVVVTLCGMLVGWVLGAEAAGAGVVRPALRQIAAERPMPGGRRSGKLDYVGAGREPGDRGPMTMTASAGTARLQVLVIEDAPPIADSLVRGLRQVGYDADRVGTARAALPTAHRPEMTTPGPTGF